MFLDRIRKTSKDDKNLIINILGTLLIKGGSLILSLFTMPAYMRFFNNDVTLGLWFTIVSVLNWMMYFDFGIGNGLRNRLTETLSKGDEKKSKKYISSAYISIGLLCTVAIIAFLILSKFINWNVVFNIDYTNVSKRALYIAVCIVFIGIVLQLIFRLVNSILYAVQKSALNNAISLIHSVIVVLALYIVPSYSNDVNIIVMAIINIVSSLLPMVVASIIVFASKKYRAIAPSFRYFDMGCAKDVLSLGGSFLIAQILYMVIMNTNEYSITLFVGNERVVEYQVYNRIFTLIGTLVPLVLTPIWSAVTKAMAEKNNKWINSLYKKILLFSLVGIACEFLIIPFSQIIVNVWLRGEAIPMSMYYGFSFAVLASFMILNSVFSTFANGLGKLKTQIICFAIGAAAKIPMSYILVNALDSWIGVVWANAISLSLYCILQPIFLKKMINKKGDN